MKVSVIIPVYNVEPYVEECLRSVMAQTCRDLEMVCIHDAGRDQSWEVVKALAKEEPRIRLYENGRNLGLAATRNRGLALAQGKYVYFLDSDDMIREDAMETLYERAEREGLEVQAFGASFLYETKALEERFRSNPRGFKREYPEVMDGRSLLMSWMEIWDWLSSQPRYFYSREFLEHSHIRYVEGMLHEDEVFALDVLMHAQRVRVSNEAFFIRRFREDSIMTSVPTIRNIEGCVRILEHAARLQAYYEGDQRLNRAVKFYMYKIFLDACRKYRAAERELGEGEALIQMVSQEMLGEPGKMGIYHLIEAVAQNGGDSCG